MDLITQGIIGAAAAQCAAKPGRLRVSAFCGALAGLLPDLDVLIRWPSDPLLFLDYHRHFTHSLVFVPLGALIAAAIAAALVRWRTGEAETTRSLYLPCLLGIATHGLLDSCTSYGTHLLWPLTEARAAWHIIAIIDPLFSLTLLTGVVLATWRRWRSAARASAVLALLYLGLCIHQQGRATTAHQALMAERGHTGERPEVKPAIGTNFLFRAFYTHEGQYHVDGIRIPWFGPPKVYPGGRAKAVDLDAYKHRYALDALRRSDIDRFNTFSNGYLIEDPRACGFLSDFRYSAVPSAVAPLWGINVLGTPTGEHLQFHRWETIDSQERGRFVEMLLGE
jgi:inner membrane protein